MLRRGVDFDDVVVGRPRSGWSELIAAELIEDNPHWRDMTTHVRTVATQAFQLWLRPRRGRARLASARGHHERLCRPVRHLGVDAPDPVGRAVARGRPTAHRRLFLRRPDAAVAARTRRPRRVCVPLSRDHAERSRRLPRRTRGLYLPGAVGDDGFAWHLLCGVNGHRGVEALQTQHVSVNIDPSDRYVQSVPGSDSIPAALRRKRLRQRGARGRLDRFGVQRRMHRGRGDLRPAGGQRAAGSRTPLPDQGLLPTVTVTAGGRPRRAPRRRTAARATRHPSPTRASDTPARGGQPVPVEQQRERALTEQHCGRRVAGVARL